MNLVASIAAVLATLACAPTARAQAPAGAPPAPAEAYTLARNIGASTEYVFRGVAQTDGDPQLFGGADLTSGAFYAGAWASNVDYGDGTDAEIDLYGGVRPQLAGWTFDLGLIGYFYPGQPAEAAYNYLEAKAGASRTFGPATFGGTAYWTPDFGGPADEGAYGELTGAYALTAAITITGALGRQALASVDADYNTWNIGTTWAATEKLVVDVRYHDTDAADRLGQAYQGRIAGGLKASF